MKICKTCGCNIIDGKHPRQFSPLTKELLERFAKIKCGGCGMEVSLETIKQQGIENWTNLSWFESCFCPGCSHSLELDK